MPPTLDTARLYLRSPCTNDSAALYVHASDPAVTRFMTWPTHVDIGDTVDFLDAVADGWAAGDECCWIVLERASQRVIGTVGCFFSEHGAELGYVLAQHAWGQGFATEAARAVFESVRQLDDIHRVWATCDVDNRASARVLEKIGLTCEALLKRWSPRPNIDPNGPPRDVCMYAWVR